MLYVVISSYDFTSGKLSADYMYRARIQVKMNNIQGRFKAMYQEIQILKEWLNNSLASRRAIELFLKYFRFFLNDILLNFVLFCLFEKF